MLTHPEPLKSLLGFQFLCLVSLRVSISGSYAWVPPSPHVNPKHVPPGLRYLLRSSKFTLVALLFSSRRQSFHDARVVEPIELVHKTKMWI